MTDGNAHHPDSAGSNDSVVAEATNELTSEPAYSVEAGQTIHPAKLHGYAPLHLALWISDVELAGC